MDNLGKKDLIWVSFKTVGHKILDCNNRLFRSDILTYWSPQEQSLPPAPRKRTGHDFDRRAAQSQRFRWLA